MLQTKDDKSFGELFGDLTREMSTLVRQEVQLAKTELTEKAVTTAKGAALIIVAACLGFVAFQALVAAAILGLAQVVQPWLAAVIVGGALAAIAGVLAMMAIAAFKKGGSPVPQQTVETIKEDVQWAKQQMR